MELNREIDAIIIGKIAERKSINSIKSNDILLNCLSSIGLIASQIKKNHSPVSYLTPLFINVTLLARKANVDLGAILDNHQYSSKLNYNDQLISLAELSKSIIELNYLSLDFFDLNSISKSEIKAVHIDALKECYLILKNISLIATLNNSDICNVQKNAVKHINQLAKII